MDESKTIVGVEPKDFYIELDRRDQQQIVMAIMGEVVDELFYEVHGKKALSWEGINTVAYLMGDIEVDKGVEWERIEMFGDRVYWSATVRAQNTRFGLASLGTAEAPEQMDVYDRDDKNQKIPDPQRKGEFMTHLEPDEHCRRKALSKAQRNAKRAVMPTAVLKKWLQYFTDLHLFRKGTRREMPVMPFKPKTVDAEYQVLGDPKPTEKKETKKPVKPKETKPKEEPQEKPPEEEPIEAPRPPESIEQVEEYLGNSIIGLDTYVKVSEYEDFFRVGKMKRLDKEIEDQIDGLVDKMGGEWNNDANCWRISKE